MNLLSRRQLFISGPFIVLLALIGLTACSDWPDFQYKIIELRLFNNDNSGYDAIDVPTDSISAKAYVIRMQYMVKLTGDNSKADANESGYINSNRAIGFTIFSLTNFDSTHPALSPLNSYFLYGENSHVNASMTIDNAVNKNNLVNTYRSYDEAESEEPWKINRYLVLMNPPAFMGNRDFVVDILFEDKSHIRDTINVTLY